MNALHRTTLSLTVFTQINFVAYFLQAKCDFRRKMAVIAFLRCRLSHASPFPHYNAPSQVRSRWTYQLPYYSVFCSWYISLRRDLDFDHVTLKLYVWPWTFAVFLLWRDETLQNLNAIELSAAEFAISIFDLMTLNMCYCCARLSGNFHQSLTFDNLSVPEL